MASRIISNENNSVSLTNLIQDTIENSETLDFLVGYFYFSGFEEIYKSIGDRPLRILVGMDADVNVKTLSIEEYSVYQTQSISFPSIQTVQNDWVKTCVNIINNVGMVDTKENYDAFKFFKQKILNGTLQVRKTRDPNHAKMYLFSLQKKQQISNQNPGKVIIGSSNFSYQGFRSRNEINVFLQDSHDYNDAKAIFDALWLEACPLIGPEDSHLLTHIIEHTWFELIPSPYLLYIRTLYEYFKEGTDVIKSPKQLTRNRNNPYFDLDYQTDAIRDGVYIVNKHSGVIIADVVGLGKSIIAASIAANLESNVVIITPPHLKSQWSDYASDFGLRGCQIYTSGKIEEAAQKNIGNENLTIIIDEAHRYRNEDTESYGHLHQLCASNKIILLSATPFNNKPEDLFALIKLFQIPGRSTIQTVDDLGKQMSKLIAEHKELRRQDKNKELSDFEFQQKSKKLAKQIRTILDPVVIRRTRIDLEKLDRYKKDLERQRIQFSQVMPPRLQEYNLGSLADLYRETLDLLIATSENTNIDPDKIISHRSFTGARYKPLTYLINDKGITKKYAKYFEVENFQLGQKNLASFMQQLFVRRFESAKYSFIKTVENVLNSMNHLREWYVEFGRVPLYKEGKLPDFNNLQNLYDESQYSLFEIDDFLELELQPDLAKGLFFVEARDLTDSFLIDLESDIALFKKFIHIWSTTSQDPKFDSIIETIRYSLDKEPSRKIIIFTEFTDTAAYLQGRFEENQIRSMMYTSDKATKKTQEAVRANFDAGLEYSRQKNEYDVLVATDAISEGFSLHRAGTIFNYDIPYNPTRVIQRVGRINRINKKVFDKLYIYNFFPTATGESISHTAQISTFKMRLFQAILGSDTQILTDTESMEGYLGEQFWNAQNEDNTESWDVTFRNELHSIETNRPEILKQAITLPYRCRVARDKTVDAVIEETMPREDMFESLENEGVLLFSTKGDSHRFVFTSKTGKSTTLDPEQALSLFKADIAEKGHEVSDSFYPLYQQAQEDIGTLRVNKKFGRQILAVRNRLLALHHICDVEPDRHYLTLLVQILELDSIPSYYLKKLAKIPATIETIHNIKSLIPPAYLEKLITKDCNVSSEPETILLAEELCQRKKK